MSRRKKERVRPRRVGALTQNKPPVSFDEYLKSAKAQAILKRFPDEEYNDEGWGVLIMYQYAVEIKDSDYALMLYEQMPKGKRSFLSDLSHIKDEEPEKPESPF